MIKICVLYLPQKRFGSGDREFPLNVYTSLHGFSRGRQLP